MRKKILIGAVVPVVASLGLWLGYGGGAAAHATGNRTAVSQSEEVTTGPDTDNIQSGDQTSSDNSNSNTESGGTSESGGGSENSGESDGPGGHADPAGDVNHECTGNCQE